MNKVLIIFFAIILYSLFVGIILTIYININSKKRHRIELLDVDRISFVEKSITFFKNIIDFFGYYFYVLCLILSRGFFFLFYLLFYIIYKITKIKFFDSAKNFIHKISENPISFLLLLIIVWSLLFYQLFVYKTPDVFYVEDNSPSNEVVVDDNQDNNNGTNISDDERNLYRYYSSYGLSDIDINKLKNTNSDVVSWIIVDNTSVNYPVLKTDNNVFYLSHDINKNFSVGGWIFMDYRNDPLMDNYNTIFYGHNLINNTAFGGLSRLFTDSWFKKSNHRIVIINSEHKYTYEVFSVYYSDAELYYLTTNFYSNDEYLEFLNTIKGRSKYNFDSSLDVNDKIITLSTCSDDNLGRKVVHAKLIKVD